jgi:hypothetical protein
MARGPAPRFRGREENDVSAAQPGHPETIGPRAPRYDLRTPVGFRNSEIRGTGTVWNMSESGALIEQVFWRAIPGTRLSLDVSFPEERKELVLAGEVVRNSATGGFAVKFSELPVRERSMLSQLLPRVGTPTS